MTPRALALKVGGVLLIAALLADFFIGIQLAVVLSGIGFVLLLVFDLIWALRIPKPSIEREMDLNIPVQIWQPVQLHLKNLSQATLRFQVHDLYDDHLQAEGLPQTINLKGKTTAKLLYRLKATKRGHAELKAVDGLFRSPLGFWDIRKTLPCETVLRVQPNYQQVMEFALLGDEQANARLGTRQQRRRGEGTEFHQLREYQNGDPMRKIDWKASSRIGKLISKDFQDEQDQQLVFLLDSGRRMRHKDEHVEHMDQALNAMLLVSHVAAQQGDSVGFMAFGQSDHWCPPRKSKAIIKHLLDHCYDIHAGLVTSDYLSTAQRLLELQKRRAMVVILTNSRDEDREDLEKAIVILRKRHLVVVADLHEAFINTVQQREPKSFEEGLTFLATEDYMIQRHKMHQSLSALGAICLDCTSEQLPAALVNSYQQIKHSGRL